MQAPRLRCFPSVTGDLIHLCEKNIGKTEIFALQLDSIIYGTVVTTTKENIMDLSNLSIAELRQLQDDIKKQMKKREQDDLAKAREQIMAIAQSVGVSVKDLVGTNLRLKTGAVAARFRNPANPSQQWTGRGRQPNWVKEWAAEGKSMDLLKI